MGNSIPTALLAVVTFASTNVDDILILVLFFSSGIIRPLKIVVGQFIAITLVTAGSLILSLLARKTPLGFSGLLGIIPIAMGLRILWDRRKAAVTGKIPTPLTASESAGIFSVITVTLANGGDNVAVYVPLFATKSPSDLTVIVTVFLLMTALWCVLAHSLVHQPRFKSLISNYGHAAYPWVLIALGGYTITTSL